MAIPSSGAISMTTLSGEFGGAAPYSISQFYRGGGRVPNASVNNSIPTSGSISFSNFYGATNRVAINVTISGNVANYVFNTAKVPGYIAGVTDVTLTINSGVVVSASTTGTSALTVDTSWNSGDTVRINNYGVIVGMGGAGGGGSDGAGSAGAGGGRALTVSRAITFGNYGTIAGGGGGGGGGGGAVEKIMSFYYICAGGGGGGGRTGSYNSGGGAGGISERSRDYGSYDGYAGGAGTYNGEGGGGGGPWLNKPGATGGTWGAAGGTGTAGNAGAGGAGGPAGAAVSGNGYITWSATGTRYGAIG